MIISLKTLIRKFFSIAFPLISLGFFIYYAFTNFNTIPALKYNFQSVSIGFSTIFFILFNIFLGGAIWQLLLRDHGINISTKSAQVIFSVSQFGKYLPGNVGQHVGRVIMAKENGIPLSITLNTIFVEILWNTGIAGGLSLLALVLLGAGKNLGHPTMPSPLSLATLVLLLLSTPWLIIGCLNRFLPTLAKRFTGGEKIISPRLKTALIVAALFLLCFITMGLILKLQAQFFFGVAEGNLFELACLFSLAWLAGYIAPGAPGGLGVREAMMALLLTPILGAGTAVGLGVTLRVTTTAGDALAFALGLLGKKLPPTAQRG